MHPNIVGFAIGNHETSTNVTNLWKLTEDFNPRSSKTDTFNKRALMGSVLKTDRNAALYLCELV
jgi:hypothetical protein